MISVIVGLKHRRVRTPDDGPPLVMEVKPGRAEMEQERERIIEWLSPLNFFTRQSHIFGRRHPGTGEWLLQSDEFKNWVDNPAKTLWCTGDRKTST